MLSLLEANDEMAMGALPASRAHLGAPLRLARPGAYTRAQERIREIIDQRLTVPMAEPFVQANIGKQTPYLGIIYLRLGELHEESGDSRTAIEIYRDVIDLFPGREDIVSEANNHLTRLGVVS